MRGQSIAAYRVSSNFGLDPWSPQPIFDVSQNSVLEGGCFQPLLNRFVILLRGVVGRRAGLQVHPILPRRASALPSSFSKDESRCRLTRRREGSPAELSETPKISCSRGKQWRCDSVVGEVAKEQAPSSPQGNGGDQHHDPRAQDVQRQEAQSHQRGTREGVQRTPGIVPHALPSARMNKKRGLLVMATGKRPRCALHALTQ